MSDQSEFDLRHFLPYLLNQAADASSVEFQKYYKTTYGMLRTEWRVLFHLGSYGNMTAKEICDRARIHKTKVSRAVQALSVKRFINRSEHPDDRRLELLALTRSGQRVYQDLYRAAQAFDAKLMEEFSPAEQAQLRRILTKIAGL